LSGRISRSSLFPLGGGGGVRVITVFDGFTTDKKIRQVLEVEPDFQTDIQVLQP